MSTTIPSPSALGGRLAQKVPRRYIFSDDLTRLSRLDREFDDIVWSASSGTYDRAGGDLECSAKLFSARFYKMLGMFTDVCNVLLLCTRVGQSFGLRLLVFVSLSLRVPVLIYFSRLHRHDLLLSWSHVESGDALSALSSSWSPALQLQRTVLVTIQHTRAVIFS